MRSAFVIMSFKDEYERVYHQGIRPALDAIGCNPLRVDQAAGPGVITSDIVRMIIGADLVVADISEPSPNVFYELGISHSVGNKTIMTIRKDRVGELPFDVQVHRVIDYPFDSAGFQFLQLRLEKSGRELLESTDCLPNNLVQEAGREYFDYRRKVDRIVDDLDSERERIRQFADLLAMKEQKGVQDNTEAADAVVSQIIDSRPSPRHRIVISICGPGCIGKSTFSRLVADRLCSETRGRYRASILGTDGYMLARKDRLRRGLSGFEPESHDLRQLTTDVEALLRGQSITIRPYSHVTGRHEAPIVINPSDVLILEGIFSFYPTLIPLSRAHRYFIHGEEEQAKELKFIADCLERNHDVRTAFRQAERDYNAYQTFIFPYLRLADYVILVSEYWKYKVPRTNWVPNPPTGILSYE